MTEINQEVICDDIYGKTYKVQSSELSFRPAVYAVIIHDGKVLLSKQWEGYDFPGGAIELGESTADALIREVKEETGLVVKVGKLLHCDNSFFKLPFKGSFVHSIQIFHQCEVVGGELSTQFLDEQELRYVGKAEWINLEDFANVKIYSSVDAKKVLSLI
ncbi:NUDIX domain-containing protein [Candidatus Woesebacteria bacterium]|nr:NUDIX domain-containing protein [Candidatus Woesebacteria bacterium]